MLRVDLYDWSEVDQDTPNVDVWFTFSKGDKEVKIHSIEESGCYFREITEGGILGRLSKRFYLKDGLAFMHELKYAFTGSRIRASDIYKV